MQPGGGPYGPDTCIAGYVWREAFSGDDVCVKVMPLCAVTSVNVTFSDARVGTIARYAATAAAAHDTSRRGRGLAIIWASWDRVPAA